MILIRLSGYMYVDYSFLSRLLVVLWLLTVLVLIEITLNIYKALKSANDSLADHCVLGMFALSTSACSGHSTIDASISI